VDTSGRKQFLDIEKEFLQPLPQSDYQIKHYKRAKVQKMGYVYLCDDKNYYSVPYRYIGKQVEVQYNQESVEIYYNSERIASHKRTYKAGRYTTIKEHMSSTHLFYDSWSPDYFVNLAGSIGPQTSQYIEKLIDQQDYPETGYKQSLGIIALKKAYEPDRIERACTLALTFEKCSYRTVMHILENNMDKEIETESKSTNIPLHTNIRGPQAFC